MRVTETTYCGELVLAGDEAELARLVRQQHDARHPEAEPSDDELLLLLESSYEATDS